MSRGNHYLPDLTVVFVLAGIGLASLLGGAAWLVWWFLSSFTFRG